jgi:hypothetical protein
VARQKKMQFYLTEEEHQSLKEYAEAKKLSMGEVLREYVKSLMTKA